LVEAALAIDIERIDSSNRINAATRQITGVWTAHRDTNAATSVGSRSARVVSPR